MGKRVVAVAVVVGVLVAGALGVAGMLVANGRGQRTPAKLPALQVSGEQPGASVQRQATASRQAGPAPGDAGDAGAAGDAEVAPSGRIRYQLRGTLPDLPDSSRAWILDAQVDKARVAELAGKLGLAGEPKRSGSAWTVTSGRGQLFVSTTLPGGPWTFATTQPLCGAPVRAPRSNGAVEPGVIGCPAAVPLLQGVPSVSAPSGQPSSAPSAGSSAPSATKRLAPPTASPRPRLPRPVELPDRASAERIVRDLLVRVGAPTDGIEVRLVRAFDRWSVSASPSVGGMPTSGFVWTAAVGAKGQVLSATGWLGRPRPGDDYPLITEQEALQRLRDRQVSGPIVERGPGAPVGPGSPPCDNPAEPGGCGAAEPRTLEVTDLRLGLQLASTLPQPGGAATRRVSYLVPTYFFQIGGSWDDQAGVVAVQDRFLTAPPPPTAVPLGPGG